MGDATPPEVKPLATTQGTNADAMRSELTSTFKAQLDAAKSTLDFLSLLGTIESFIIGQNPQSAPDKSNFQLIWHMMIKIAIECCQDDGVPERVIYLLLATREIALQSKNEGEAVRVIEGRRIWIDLPYFLDILNLYWDGAFLSSLKAKHRYNLAAFSARLLAAGICGDEVGIFALRCFRRTLDRESVKDFETMNACVAWLFYCRYKLLNMSVTERKYNQGYMFSAGGLSQEEKDGFSIDLWLKWRESFKELTVGGHRMVQAEAAEGYRLMIVSGVQMGYDIPGEQEYLDHTKKLLEGVLRESGMESASLADIKNGIN